MEELSMNAWPAPRRVFHDGWVLGFGGGFTGRANSVHPIYDGSFDVEEKIGFCERAYAAQRLPTLFKMSPAYRPDDLEERLTARGYRTLQQTSVRVVELEKDGTRNAAMEIRDAPEERWLKSVVQFRGLSDHDAHALATIVKAIARPTAFASIVLSDGVAACGLGVVDGPWVGLFDIVTREDRRGRGHATSLVRGLLAWATRLGATRAYLQVMLENAAALRLYDKLGFREAYRYCYRKSPQ
jgi:ribosomal protein S18 acetylase RimI-like enzyme